MSVKKVLYIMGAGRSGTTLLDIILGNANNVFSVGEIIKFPYLRACPHGFPKSSPNYKFWKTIEKSFFSKISYSYNTLVLVSKIIESHSFFFLNYFDVIPPTIKNVYRKYINTLFSSIFENINADIVVDSSKYPGRALALSKFLNYPIYIIYLVRDPRGVVKSFSKKNVEQPPKKFIQANIYYFVINMFCHLVLRKLRNVPYIKIKYENLIKNPEDQLRNIQDTFMIDLTESINKIKNKIPLKVGYLFEGNRIRLLESIYLQNKELIVHNDVKSFITYFLNKIWYK